MTILLRRSYCRSLLLVLNLLLINNSAFAVIAPDITSLTSISSSLTSPVRLAEDSSGFLYVSDPRSGGIVKFTSAGTYQAKINSASNSLGVAVVSSGDLLVSQGATIAVYSPAGTKVKEFGAFGKANGIAITASGSIYVADSTNNNVQVFNSDYSPRSLGASNSFGSVGTATGQFRQPTGISYEKVSDQLAVVDTRNGRVQFFSPVGVYQKSIGSFGAGPLKFTSPQSVSFEYSADQATLKRMYVVDAFQSTIQIIDGATFDFVRYIGSYGITDGKLVTPSDILFDKNSQLVVANGTGKLSLFKIADPINGPLLQIDALPQATNLATLLFSGTTTGATVTVNGTAATVNGTLWSISVNLTIGVNTFTVVATDSKGISTTKTVSVTALTPAKNPVSLTVSSVASQTALRTLALSGTVTAGGAVTITNSTNGSTDTIATVSGSSWNAAVSLIAGANTLRIAANKSGMDSSTFDLMVTLDTSMPVIATRLPSTGSIFSTPLQTLTGTVIASSAVTIVVTVNGKTEPPVQVSGGVFSIPVTLAQGSNSVTLVAVDSFGVTIQSAASLVTYNPQAPRITVTTPAAAVSGTQAYHLEGAAPAGSSVTVNGTAATVTGTVWKADVILAPGTNSFEVKATVTQASGVPATTTTMTEVSYSPGVPSLAIISPAKDAPVATSSYILTGSATAGTVVTALINGVPTPVSTSASGAFSLTIPTMTIAAGASTGTYTVVVSVTDSTGATSTSTRSIIYDPKPQTVTTVSVSPVVVTTTAGVLFAKDKNGPILVTPSVINGVTTLDLTGITFDPATLNIQALSAAGLSSRNGSFAGNAKPVIADALQALKISANQEPTPPFSQMLSGDVAPLVNFESKPDGKIDLDDVVVILNKVLGLIP
jgi:hypothetical protein